MKLAAPGLAARTAPSVRGAWGVCAELVKARLTSMVMMTALAGFLMGWSGPIDHALLISALLGIALLASGAAVLNQYLERHHDGRMERTRRRPIPAGDIPPERALLLGLSLSLAGTIVLAVLVNPQTCLLGAVTLVIYVGIYTPLKRTTSLNTLVGAVPGALPPLMGWTAARGSVDAPGWTLFLLLFLWQIPHFLAIAWMYRDQYQSAGFAMLPSIDPSGRRTGWCALAAAAALLPACLLPQWLGMAGAGFSVGALALSLAYLACAAGFLRRIGNRWARRLFLASIIYLPLILGLLVLYRTSPS